MDILLQPTPNGDGTYFGWLLSGAGWTVTLALGAWLIASVVGTLVGIARTFPALAVSGLARLYVEVFRNIPLLVQMFFWFFVLPELLPKAWGDAIKQMPPPWAMFLPSLFCLGLFTAVRVAEQVRSGIEGLPFGQKQAAAALGMSLGQTYRYVLLPQAFRIVVPTLTSEFMTVFKNTSLALTIGLLELTAQARQIGEYTFATFTAYAAATVGYLVIALGAYSLMREVECRTRLPGAVSVGAIKLKKTIAMDPMIVESRAPKPANRTVA